MTEDEDFDDAFDGLDEDDWEEYWDDEDEDEIFPDEYDCHFCGCGDEGCLHPAEHDTEGHIMICDACFSKEYKHISWWG